MFWTTTFIFWTADDAVAGTQSGGQTETPDSYPAAHLSGVWGYATDAISEKESKNLSDEFLCISVSLCLSGCERICG